MPREKTWGNGRNWHAGKVNLNPSHRRPCLIERIETRSQLRPLLFRTTISATNRHLIAENKLWRLWAGESAFLVPV